MKKKIKKSRSDFCRNFDELLQPRLSLQGYEHQERKSEFFLQTNMNEN